MFSKATVCAFNGERGLAYDAYGNSIRFSKEDVHGDDLQHIAEGAEIVYLPGGRVELVVSHFVRWHASLDPKFLKSIG